MAKGRFKKYLCKFLKCPGNYSGNAKNCHKTAASFGAAGDGTNDDTGHLQDWLDDLKVNGGCYCLGPGTYIQSKELALRNASGFVIDGCNGILKYKDGAPVEWGYTGIHLVDCSEFEIRNLTIDGNRANRSEAEVPAHSIYMRGCRNFKLTNVRSKYAVVDGFYFHEKDGIIIANNLLKNSSDDSAAFNVTGNNCIIEGNQIEQATKCAIYVEGCDCKILNNVLLDTIITTNEFGTIRTKDGSSDIRGNTVKLSTENRSAFAIRIADGDHGANFVKHNVIARYKSESTWDGATYQDENIIR